MIQNRAVLDAVRDAVFLADVDTGMIVDANPAAEALCGWKLAELQSMHHTQLYPPEWAEAARSAFKHYAHVPGVGETLVVHRDGHRIPVEVSSSHFTTTEGQHILVGVSRDLTARNAARDVLQQSEERLRLAIKATNDAIWDCDLKTGIVTWNETYSTLYGRPDETSDSWRWWIDRIHPEDRERTVAGLRSAISSGALSWICEYRFQRVDGAWADIHDRAYIARDPSGEAWRVIGAMQDLTERKRAEVALRESEELFRTIADAAPVMIWRSGPDKVCSFLSKPWLDFRGRSMEQELNDGWTEGVHPEDSDRCLETYSSSFDARHPFQLQYRLRRADGEYRWVLEHGIPLYRNGEFAGYIGSCVDVTEQKLIEKRLQASEARLMEAQRLTKVGSWERSIDPKGTHYWSEEMLRIVGLPDGSSRDFETFLSYIHPKDREKVLESVHQLGLSTTPNEVEYRIVRPDGDVRFVRSVAAPIGDGNGLIEKFVGATQDITEQVEAREVLRESEERLKSAERMAHVGNWIWDIKVNRVSCSEGMLRILGQLQDYEPSYEESFQLVTPQDRERADKWVKVCLAEKRGNHIEVQIRRPDGEVRTVVCRSEVLLDDEGSPARMFGTCQDVTDVRRAQAEALARQKLESVGTLANGIAHDFNNILGAVMAQAELAMEELRPGSHPREELEAICQSALRGSQIVRQLMIYAGENSEIPGLINLSEVVEKLLPLLNVSVSKHANLRRNLQKLLPPVRANASQISRLVMNLVINAAEAIGDQDGTIQVSTRRVTLGPDSPGVDQIAEGDYVQLEVSDTGSGMSAETRARVFDPFFSTKSAGRGLGLAVVHGIVRNLGGVIHLSSELGRGTTFLILLPCAETLSGTMREPSSEVDQPEWRSEAARVLIVEDEDPLRQAASKMLHKSGFSVTEARDGSAALDAIRAKDDPIDILFLDTTLPGTPGREVLKEARRLRPEMRVVVTSAYPKEMAVAALQTKVERFIRKPYRLNDLLALIQPNVS